jgi:microcystin-dependent protein
MSMTDRGHTDPASQYVDRIAGYDHRLQALERSHTHEPQTPVGAIIDFAGPNPPNLWMIADGSALSTATYPDLFAAIGYTWGGSGATFNLPDLRGRVALGAGAGAGLTNRALAASGGAETVALSAATTGTHTHGVNVGSGNASGPHNHGVNLGTGVEAPGHAHTFSVTSGNNAQDHTHSLGWTAVGAAASGPFTGIVQTGGSTPTTGVSAPHQHGVGGTTSGETVNHTHGLTGYSDNNATDHTHGVTGPTDTGTTAGAAHENMAPWRAVTKIIKVLPTTASGAT